MVHSFSINSSKPPDRTTGHTRDTAQDTLSLRTDIPTEQQSNTLLLLLLFSLFASLCYALRLLGRCWGQTDKHTTHSHQLLTESRSGTQVLQSQVQQSEHESETTLWSALPARVSDSSCSATCGVGAACCMRMLCAARRSRPHAVKCTGRRQTAASVGSPAHTLLTPRLPAHVCSHDALTVSGRSSAMVAVNCSRPSARRCSSHVRPACRARSLSTSSRVRS